MKHLDLFSGIGGFALAARWMGWETVAFCDIEPFTHGVLAKHWAGTPIFNDVKEISRAQLESEGIADVGIISGGFPCQDVSIAGKQDGLGGERSGLWSELCRIIGDVGPRWAVIENVPALLQGDDGAWFQRVLWDISQIGYDAEWHCIPATFVGAPHRRDRVWIVCHPGSGRQSGNDGGRTGAISQGRCSELANSKGQPIGTGLREGEPGRQRIGRSGDGSSEGSNTQCERLEGIEQGGPEARPTDRSCYGGDRSWWATEPNVGRVAHGVPSRVDRLKGLGNAIVPQVAYQIFQAIQEVENGTVAQSD